jgi:two-component system OmpR family sensor kinase
MARLSLRTRLVLGVLMLATVGLLTADAVTYTSLRSFLFDRTDKSLDGEHRVVEAALQGGVSPAVDAALRAPGPGLYIQFRSLSGRTLGVVGPTEFPGEQPPPAPDLPAAISLPDSGGPGQGRARYFTVGARSGGGRYRVRASLDPGDAAVLIVALSLRDVDGTLHRLLWIEALVTAAVLAAIAALGLWIVRIGLRPLQAIGATADAITAGDLSRRVERADETTEVGRLGLALNAMLGRIEDSDRRLRRFVADASHELRTPLSAVRAYAELFERGADRRPEDLARAMTGIGRESERMSLMVDDLLLLARLDEGRPLEREPVDLEEVLREAVETARAVDPGRPLELAAVPARVLGDRERLRQIVDNLLGNVRAHTPAGTAARVELRAEDGQARIAVSDSGPGIPPEDVPRLFERFYRADASRARASGGVGLGLAIVAAVAAAHGGRAEARSSAEGSVFEIVVPLDTTVAAQERTVLPAPAS